MPVAISPLDLAVIVIYLVGTLTLGLAARRKDADTDEYFLARNELPWWALLLSIVATETSMVTFLSVPGKSFVTPGGDLRFLQLAMGYILGRIVAARFLLPHYFQGELVTAYDLLEHRAGRGTRYLASLMFLISRTLGDALRLYLAALVLRQLVPWNVATCVLVMGIITAIYTVVGGLRSVVWNDCVQFVIYVIGAVWAFAILLQKIPGHFPAVWEFALATGKTRMIDPRWGWTGSEYTLGAGLIGGALLALASHGTDQMIVQRLLGARSQRDARRALVMSGFVVFAQFLLFLVIGIALACHHSVHPGEVASDRVDDVFAAFLVRNLPAGVLGVVLAALMAAAMSTQSSSLNASASALVGDFLRPRVVTPAIEQRLLLVGKLATLLFGVAQVGIAMTCDAYVRDRSLIDQVIAIAAFTNGPILGLFFLCLIVRGVSPLATGVGFVAGLAAVSYLAWGTALSSLWYTAAGAAVVCLVGTLFHAVFATPSLENKQTAKDNRKTF